MATATGEILAPTTNKPTNPFPGVAWSWDDNDMIVVHGGDRLGVRGSAAWMGMRWADALASLPQADRDFRLMVLETQGLA